LPLSVYAVAIGRESAFRNTDHLLGNGSKLFGPWQRRLDSLVLEQGSDEAAKQRAPFG